MAVAQRSRKDKEMLWEATADARKAVAAWSERPKWKPEYAASKVVKRSLKK